MRSKDLDDLAVLGNVYEWNETANDSFSRTRRGGSRVPSAVDTLKSSFSSASDPGNHNNFLGFRVASAIPEPGTMLLAGSAAAICFVIFRRRSGVS